MKTLSVLFFALIFILVIQPEFKSNSVWAQIPKVSNPVCVDCENGNCTYHSKKNDGSNSGSVDYRLMLIQSLLNFLTSDKSTDNAEKQRQLEEQQRELRRIEVENEKQRLLKEKIEQEIHNKLMALTKKLPDSGPLKEKNLIKESFEGKSFDGDGKNLEYKEIDIKSPVDLTNKEDFDNLAKIDSLVKLEQIKYDNNFDEWVKDNNGEILNRLKKSDPYLDDLIKSIKTKVPPPPVTKSNDLKPGDVLLVGNYLPNPITGLDMIFSGTLDTKASHTLLYLKEIGGQKMFLDHQPFKGEKIITEHEFFELYGQRPMEVARYKAQPLSSDIGNKLYSAAFELVGENEQYKHDNPYGIFTGTKYGLGEDMVCSEADKWVLRKAGFLFPDTEDKVKKLMGLDFSPADFKKSGYFYISPF